MHEANISAKCVNDVTFYQNCVTGRNAITSTFNIIN